MYQEQPTRKPITITTLAKMKRDREKFAVLTAYDASFAALLEAAGVEVILVGDSLGMVVQGQGTTVPVTMEDMIYHTRIDLSHPDGSARLPHGAVDGGHAFRQLCHGRASDTQRCPADAGRRCADGQAGGRRLPGRDGPPARPQRHSGLRPSLLPQSVHKLGGYKVQGREEAAARQIIDEALALQDAGADVALVECIPAELGARLTEAFGARLTEALDIPLIGIGAGSNCDAQVLVSYDMLGITAGRRPKFSKNFLSGRDSAQAAVEAYVHAVKSGEFPGPEHCIA